MSFDQYKKFIEEGDTVILFLGYDNMLQFTIDSSKTHQTKYGALRHKDLIGVEYGSKVQCSRGFVYILHPTPELWTLTLPHRTQILYSTDISLVTLQLDLKPGSVVVESGTGSGSLSHAILRNITPGGYLHTYDFHEQRVEKAAVEFRDHGFGDSVTVKHRDVLVDGFDLDNVADAVFLDLPAPWDAIPHAKKALKKIGGRLCSFSPCIEQVQRACGLLEELGFFEIETFECLQRTFEVKTVNMPLPDMGFEWDTSGKIPFLETEDKSGSRHPLTIGSVEKDEQFDGRKAAKKQDRMQRWKNKKQRRGKGKFEEVEELSGGSDQEMAEDGAKSRGPHYTNKDKSYVFKSGIAPNQMPGHTGYLTFATLRPV